MMSEFDQFSTGDIYDHVLSTRYLASLLSIAVALPALPLADVFYRGCEGLLGCKLVDAGFSGCIPNEPNVMNSFRFFAGCLALLFLVVPELSLHVFDLVPHTEFRQVWNRLRFRLHFSWIALYLVYVVGAARAAAVEETSSSSPDLPTPSSDMSPIPDFLWVSCFPETIRSPVGYIGLCALVSCVSSGTWLILCSFVYMVPPSELPRDPTADGVHEFVWMLLFGFTNYMKGDAMVSQIAHFIVLRVLTHFITSHTFKSLKPLVRRPISKIHSSELSEIDFISDNRCVLNKYTQFKAMITLALLVALPACVGMRVFTITESPIQSVWAAFPAYTIFGKASRWLFKYCVFWNSTWFYYQEYWGDRFVCYPRQELAQIYGKLLDLIVDGIIFIPIYMSVSNCEEEEFSVDTYALFVWMAAILFQRFKSYCQAVRRVKKLEDATTMSQGEPQIEDICMICAGDIFISEHSLVEEWAMRTIQCGHVFHLTCIRNWVNKCSCSCPICGRVIKAPLRSQTT